MSTITTTIPRTLPRRMSSVKKSRVSISIKKKTDFDEYGWRVYTINCKCPITGNVIAIKASVPPTATIQFKIHENADENKKS